MTDEKTGLQAPETQNIVTGEVTPNGARFSEAVPSGKTSQAAIWSLICGIAGFLCLPSIPAVILGIIALVNINKSKGLLKGTGMAVAGLILVGLWIIAIPFIAIVAAIAIPAFLTTHQIDRETYPITKTYPIDEPTIEKPIEPSERYKANEASAIANLRMLCSTEAIWRQQDVEGNGIKDYWTYDVSCFNRMYCSDGITKVILIDISLARADANRAVDGVFGKGAAFENWDAGPTQLSSAPKSGYYFQAMELDENGNSYNQNEVGERKIKATNDSKFAFVAYPDEYAITGIYTFIVNEKGVVYNKDIGNVRVLKWPGQDPTKQGWQISDHY